MKKIIFLLLLISSLGYSQTCPTMHSKVDSLVACKFRLKGFSTGLLKISTNGAGVIATAGSDYSTPSSIHDSLVNYLKKSNNLSDLTNAGVARTNLGLGTLATQNGTFSGTSSGTNTGDQTISIIGDATASGSTGVLNATVTKINGTSLAGLATGILKNTTSTGVPSIAVSNTDYLPVANPTATGTATIDSAQVSKLNVGGLDTTTYLRKVYIFGTSITQGAFSGSNHNNANGVIYTYANQYSNISGAALYNKGVSGSTMVTGGTSPMETRVSEIPTYSASTCKHLIFEYGVNDANNGAGTYDSTTFKTAYGKVIDTATVRRGWPAAKIILLVTYTSNVQTKLVYATVKTLANTKGCIYAAAYEAMVSAGTGATMDADAIHPNRLGHYWTAQSILIATSETYRKHSVINNNLAVSGNLQVGGVIEGGVGYSNPYLQIAPPVNFLQTTLHTGAATFTGQATFNDYLNANSDILVSTQSPISSTSGTIPALRLSSTFRTAAGTGGVKISLLGANNEYGWGVSTGFVDNYSGGGFTWYTTGVAGLMRLTTNGRLFVGGTTTATAILHLKAGTSSSSTAPLKFTSGTSLATPEDGAIEYNGVNYFVTVSTTRYTLAKTLTNTATLNFGNTIAGAATDLTLTVTGAASGDVCAVGAPNGSVPTNGAFSCWVSAADTVTVRFVNPDVLNPMDPASGTFRVSVIKY